MRQFVSHRGLPGSLDELRGRADLNSEAELSSTHWWRMVGWQILPPCVDGLDSLVGEGHLVVVID